MARRPLLEWLEANSNRGIHFAQAGDEWDFWTHSRLAQLSRRVAWGLTETRLPQNQVAVIAGCEGPEFVAALFGAMLAGMVPSPVAPPAAFRDSAAYSRHFEAVLWAARPSVVIAKTEFVDDCRRIAERDCAHITSVAELVAGIGESETTPKRPLSELALIQFTSGSTGCGRGIRVPFEALESNVEMIRCWLHWTAADAFANWLPLYHDMGLIGGLIGSLVSQSDLWLLQPSQFVRRPLRYLRCFGASGARLTVTASFGLNLILRKIKPEALEGLDFSGWRGMVVGAERIEPRLLDEWYRVLAPHGFQRRTILPAYGLAEATLAVTGLPLDEEWTGVEVDGSSLAVDREVTVRTSGGGIQTIVGCGRPLQGVSITVQGQDGRGLDQGMVGEIVVQGPSVASGYVGECDVSSFTAFCGDGLHTGDAGFMRDGQLFVLGRLGDSIKVRGCTVFGEAVEVALAGIGVPRQRMAALLGVHEGGPAAVVLFERFEPQWLNQVERIVRLHAGDSKIILLDAPRGTILWTSSGKPKRRTLWRDFVDGKLPGTIVGPPAPKTLVSF